MYQKPTDSKAMLEIYKTIVVLFTIKYPSISPISHLKEAIYECKQQTITNSVKKGRILIH